MSRWSLRVGASRRPAKAGFATTLRLAIAIGSALAAASADRAVAADWPDALRGSLTPSYARWDGWHFGLEAGIASTRSDFGNGTSSLVAFILRSSTLQTEAAPSEWATLSPDAHTGYVFGGFLGYNVQWDQLVVGFDLGYKYGSALKTATADSISRSVITSDNVQHDVTIAAQSNLKLVDYATLRGRAGYAFGQFLPYAVVGAVVGRFNYGTTVDVSDIQTQLPSPPGAVVPFAQSSSSGKDNAYIGGVVVGLGSDWAVTPTIFLRAEWEYIAFAPVNGTRPNINTAQVGIGTRF
jgi:outer membrane immunogenic protein